MIKGVLAGMAVAIIALGVAAWYWHGAAETARHDANVAQAELAGLRLAKTAQAAAREAQDTARQANEMREREHARALDEICGHELGDADYFRALDSLLHKTAGAGAAAPGCEADGGLPGPGNQ